MEQKLGSRLGFSIGERSRVHQSQCGDICVWGPWSWNVSSTAVRQNTSHLVRFQIKNTYFYSTNLNPRYCMRQSYTEKSFVNDFQQNKMIFTENQIYLLNLATQILRKKASALAMLGECEQGETESRHSTPPLEQERQNSEYQINSLNNTKKSCGTNLTKFT